MISGNEALVVYSGEGDKLFAENEGKNGTWQRNILYGPRRYVPKPTEWIHEFSWHGEDPTNKTKKVRGALQFQKLRIIADQFYFNVPEVRTKDDTQITVKLMIFFQLVDIEKMLDSTHDPVADFINAVASDTVQYCSGLTYQQFVENTGVMNQLETFGQLTSRAEMIGYKINKVVFRGFHSSDALQQMHDHAIHERARLRLEAESEAHRQETLDLQLTKNEERSRRERELEKEKENHRIEMAREKHAESLRLETDVSEHKQNQLDQKLTREGERCQRELEMKAKEAEHERELEMAAHTDRLRREKELGDLNVELDKKKVEVGHHKVKVEEERLKVLESIGVDISQVLVAECRNPDKTIRLETGSDGGVGSP